MFGHQTSISRKKLGTIYVSPPNPEFQTSEKSWRFHHDFQNGNEDDF